MKKLTVLAIALVFVIVSVGAYACGDKDGSAKKVDTSNAESKMMQASVKNYDTNVATAQTTGDKADDSASVKTAVAEKVNSEACGLSAKAKAAGYNCPAAKDCPAQCDHKAKNAKAKTTDANDNSNDKIMVQKTEEKSK